MSILSSVMSSVMSPVMSAIAVVTRYFTPLASAGSQHYTIPPWTPTSTTWGVKLKFLIANPLSPFDSTISGADIRIGVWTSSSARLQVAFRDALGGTTAHTFTNIGSAPFSKISTASIVFNETEMTLTATLNGESETLTLLSIPATRTISAIGENVSLISSIFPFNGIIANVELYDNGTLVRDYKLDEDWELNNIAVDSASGQDGQAINITSADSELYTQVDDGWLGEELWSYGDAVDSAVGAYNLIVGVHSGATQFKDGSTVLVDCLVDTVAGGCIFEVGDTTTSRQSLVDGVNSFTTVVGSAGEFARFGATGAGFTGSITNISVKQLIEVAS